MRLKDKSIIMIIITMIFISCSFIIGHSLRENNDIFIKSYEIAIGNSYRDDFFEGFVMKQRL